MKERRETVPNAEFTLVALLKACAKKKDSHEGIRIHDEIRRRDEGLLQKNPYLASTLVNMYVKCGMLSEAEQVMKSLPVRDVVSWSALISGYSYSHTQAHKVFDSLDAMRREALSPNAITFTGIFKACGDIGNIGYGERMHDEIVKRRLLMGTNDVVLATALVGMYVKCGDLRKAQKVLEELPVRNTASWNALISGYIQHWQFREAINCLDEMQIEGLCPDEVTFTCILKACSGMKAIEKGIQIHHEIVSRQLLAKDVMLGTALVDMYAKCGVMAKAQEVIEELHVHDVVAWNALIAGYVQHGQCHEALGIFEQMQKFHEQCLPNVITFVCILMACGNIGSIEKGKQIHDEIVSRKLLDTDIILGTALVDMYAKCGVLNKAKEVLEALPTRNVVTWNALIAGYAHKGEYHESLDCFQRMQSEGLSPDEVTFLCILKACGSAKAIEKGKQIHGEVQIIGFLEKDAMLCNALVDMYAKCGMLSKARQILKSLPVQDVVAWNALVVGYVHEGRCDEALDCFEWMQREGPSADEVTFLTLLKACGRIGAIDKGKQIHCEIVNKELLEKDIVLGNALVDMYGKCGVLGKACQVLEALPIRDVVSWSTLISGYGQHGRGEEALKCFEWMQCEGLLPNAITLLSVLVACSHAGLLEEAQTLFVSMSRRYGVIPNLEHHTCMVAGFGYAGHFDKAILVIKVMPSRECECALVWLALLGACRKWRNLELGRSCFDQVIQLDNSCTTAYVLMTDIFAATGMQKDAHNVETMRLKYASSRKEDWDYTSSLDDIYAKVQVVSSEMSDEGFLPLVGTLFSE